MNPITANPTCASCGQGALSASTSGQVEQTRAASISQSQQTDLTITTDEGDTVTLSLAASDQLNAGIHRSASFEEGRATASQTAYFDFSRSRQMTIAIDGHLNEEELADIREAVKTIGNMVEDFMAGDVAEMAEEAEALKELESLAGVQAAFAYERQVVVAREEKAAIEQTVRPKEQDDDHHGVGRLMRQIDRLTDGMLDPIRTYPGRLDPLMRSLRHMFDRLNDPDGAEVQENGFDQQLLQTIQTQFFQKIDVLTQSASFDLIYHA